MLRLRNNFTTVLLCAILSASCGFADLRQIGINTEPEKTDSVLPYAYSPVIIKFDTEMEQNSAEEIMQISSVLGTMNGDRFWHGNDLYFVPAAGWTAGIRYTLSLLGTVRSADGRELRLERFVSFYAVNKNTPPFLEWHSPALGESTGTNNVVFEFRFSRPMDRLSVESSLTAEGIGNKIFEWTDGRTVKVIPEKPLSPWTPYRWNIKESAKSADGVPVPAAYSGYFTTDLDKTLPRVTDVYPVMNIGGVWFPAGSGIENGIRQGQGIALAFNKTMGENVLRSLRFEPSLSGRTDFLSGREIVYIFTRDPEPQTAYTLIVSADTKDSEGLKLGEDFRITFTSDIPYMDIQRISFKNLEINYPFQEKKIPVNINTASGEIDFSVYFSLPFSPEEKQNSVQRITLAPFFPGTLKPVALQYVRWSSDDILNMRWEGLTAGNLNESHFYKLTIPGGKGGIRAQTGIYMKEDLIIFLEAVL